MITSSLIQTLWKWTAWWFLCTQELKYGHYLIGIIRHHLCIWQLNTVTRNHSLAQSTQAQLGKTFKYRWGSHILCVTFTVNQQNWSETEYCGFSCNAVQRFQRSLPCNSFVHRQSGQKPHTGFMYRYYQTLNPYFRGLISGLDRGIHISFATGSDNLILAMLHISVWMYSLWIPCGCVKTLWNCLLQFITM